VGYRIDPASGQLSLIGHTTANIDFPRNFAIDPSGGSLYVANQKGDSIVQFRIDRATRQLAPTSHVTRSVTPVALVFTGSA
jgi:6-phosphogluconolactonase